MKKSVLIFLSAVLFVASACAFSNTDSTVLSSTAKSITEESNMKITIQINDTKLNATLYNNTSAKALYELLQKGSITLNMNDYGNFEKVGTLPQSLPRNDTPTNTDAGDLILYQGNSITIYYDKNSWNFTPLGKIQGLTKSELKKILGSGSITAIFSADFQ